MADNYSMYNFNDLVHLDGDLTDADGDPVVPGSVRVVIIDPDGVSTTYTHGTDAELVNAEAGSYYIDITPNKPGLWRYAFISDGNGQAMDEGAFFVRDSPFYGG